MLVGLPAFAYYNREVVRLKRRSRVRAYSGVAIRTYFLVARSDLHASNNDGHQKHEPGGDSGGPNEACKVCQCTSEGTFGHKV